MRASCLLPLLMLSLSGCAVLHHVQIGEIDNRTAQATLVPFDVKVSEMGLDVGQIGDMAKSTGTKGGKQVDDLARMVRNFQMGPRTGLPVYTDKYAEKLIYKIHQACPSGQVTGLVSIRENREYTAISGEIIKVTGYCIRSRKPSSVAEVSGE